MLRVEAVYPAKGTQCDKVLRMLQAGGHVTPLSALKSAGSLRLSQRIIELEKMGWEIEHIPYKFKSGRRVMSYRLK